MDMKNKKIAKYLFGFWFEWIEIWLFLILQKNLYGNKIKIIYTMFVIKDFVKIYFNYFFLSVIFFNKTIWFF